MEIVWFCLALVGLRSYAVRPVTLVLVAKVAASYAVVWSAHGSITGYAATALIDIWALVAIRAIGRNALHESLQLCVIVSQGVFWTSYSFGGNLGVQIYHIGRAIFTLQLILVALPGAFELARDFRNIGRSRRGGLLGRGVARRNRNGTS